MEFKKEWSYIEFNGIELLLKKIFGQRGVKNYELYSAYTSSSNYALLGFHSLGGPYQMTVEYITERDTVNKKDVIDYAILDHIMIGEDGGLFGAFYDDNDKKVIVRFRIEGLER